ncbi:hypothetical protein ACFL6E_02440 [Candidatus Neomarinimicrobiota bacterium]
MIRTYTEYVHRYMSHEGLEGKASPGEHHFVAAYLLPRLFEINHVVPDYINPDGMKRIGGDIVYCLDDGSIFAIEVKDTVIRLTMNEYNNWIVDKEQSQHPDIFIGIGTSGLIILPWQQFRDMYLSIKGIINPHRIDSGYGPSMKVNSLFHTGEVKGFFETGHSTAESEQFESDFIAILRSLLI